MKKWFMWAVAVSVLVWSKDGRVALRARHEAWSQRRQLLKTWRNAGPQEQFAAMIQMLDASPHFRKAFRKALRVTGDNERNVEIANPIHDMEAIARRAGRGRW